MVDVIIIEGDEKMDFNDIASQVIANDDDYEENQERINTDTERLIKKRRIHDYRGI